MKRYRIGYTQGVYDMFHIGHLNLIKHAKERCEKLIVGVNTDNLVEKYKSRKTVIPENERVEIVRNLKDVDEALLVDTLDKLALYEMLSFDAVFIGSDWKGNARWENTEKVLSTQGVDVVYLPYTPNVSSTILRLEKGKEVKE
ncbi:MAG: adenylyltransferase/cytidyltransferase family protein [Selenomonadaceae bacterium]|nr:adenylyltransferase/cytidyltransferase family protein [Selenomonadaceae bacterium]